MIAELVRTPLYWLLAAIPVAFVLEFMHADGLWIFLATGLAIVPLAALMGRGTENLAATTGPAVGGLLSATFGNAAEMLITLAALWNARDADAVEKERFYDLVKASLTGSILGNALLVLGLALTLGGFRHPRQTFNRTATSLGATLLTLAALGLIIPTLYYYVFTAGERPTVGEMSEVRSVSTEIAIVLAVVYVLSLVFALGTHRQPIGAAAQHGHAPEWNRRKALTVLLSATVGVALMSELLVESVSSACESLGIGWVFVGVIIVPLIGSAAENSAAVVVATKNNLDLSFAIAVGSSTQIALFVAPVLVFANFLMSGQVLDLHFTPMETIAVLISIAVLYMVSQDGETHWFEGVMLLGVYLMLAIAFYHLDAPEGSVSVLPAVPG